jgi:large subunit ribosomal protein L15
MSMIHEIVSQAPRYKNRTRRGRGESSGLGKTSGRGGKGASARGGGPYWKTGHEGGQTPIFRRLPTRGFSNENFETNWYIVNVEQLNRFDDGATVDVNALIKAGLVPDTKQGIKILGNGELTRKLTVIAGWYSKSAHQKITSAGGAAQNLKGEEFQFPKPKPRFIPRAPKKKGGEEAPAEGGEKPAEGKAEGAKPEGKKQKQPKPEKPEKPQGGEKPPEAKEEPKAE